MQYDLEVHYKKSSNFAPRVKRRPQGSHRFYIDLYREILKNLIVKMYKAYSLDVWYVASSSGPLQSSNCAFRDNSKHRNKHTHKKHLNHWLNFKIILHKFFLGDSVQILLRLSCFLFSICASGVKRGSNVTFWPIYQVSAPGPSGPSCLQILKTIIVS